MKQFILSFPLILVVFLFACKKENRPQSQPRPGETARVTKVTNTAENFETYEYNSAGRLIKWSSQWQNGGGTVSRINHTLDYVNSNLVKTTSEAGSITYSYTGSRITSAEVVTMNHSPLSKLFFGYNAQGQLEYVLEQPYNVQAGQAVENKTVYSYYADGNLKQTDFLYRTSFTDELQLYMSKKYTQYDDKKYPLPSFVIGFHMPGVEQFKNNPLRIENYNADGSANGYSRFEYTYNTQGYPATKKHYVAVPNRPEEFPASYTYTY